MPGDSLKSKPTPLPHLQVWLASVFCLVRRVNATARPQKRALPAAAALYLEDSSRFCNARLYLKEKHDD